MSQGPMVLFLLFPIGTLNIQGILNWEIQIAPKRVRILGKVKVRVKASIIPPYVGGAKEKCHMTRHNIGCRAVTSLKSVKRNIGQNRQLIMMKQLLVLLAKFLFHNEAVSKTKDLKAVLYQMQNGVKRVIAYASKSVSKTEMNYPVHKLEFLALKWAITDKFHDYLYGGNTFDVYTDNNPLTYVLITPKLDSCSHRWVARLANYNFNLHYRSGISNIDADALSWIQWQDVLSDPDVVDFDESIGTQSIKAICNSSRISYGYCETICSGAASLPSQFVDMLLYSRIGSVKYTPLSHNGSFGDKELEYQISFYNTLF